MQFEGSKSPNLQMTSECIIQSDLSACTLKYVSLRTLERRKIHETQHTVPETLCVVLFSDDTTVPHQSYLMKLLITSFLCSAIDKGSVSMLEINPIGGKMIKSLLAVRKF